MAAPTLDQRVAGSGPLHRRRITARGLAYALCRLDIVGLEHLPAAGPVVLAGNHRSFWDGPLMFAVVARPVTFLVKHEAFAGPLAPLLRGAGQVPVVRHRVDRPPIRLALAVLERGGVVGIFPEGTRGDGRARTAKPGVGYLALRAGATVVPVACLGTERIGHTVVPRARMIFGPAVPVAPHRSGPLNRRTVAATTEQVREQLAGLVDDNLARAS